MGRLRIALSPSSGQHSFLPVRYPRTPLIGAGMHASHMTGAEPPAHDAADLVVAPPGVDFLARLVGTSRWAAVRDDANDGVVLAHHDAVARGAADLASAGAEELREDPGRPAGRDGRFEPGQPAARLSLPPPRGPGRWKRPNCPGSSPIACRHGRWRRSPGWSHSSRRPRRIRTKPLCSPSRPTPARFEAGAWWPRELRRPCGNRLGRPRPTRHRSRASRADPRPKMTTAATRAARSSPVRERCQRLLEGSTHSENQRLPFQGRALALCEDSQAWILGRPAKSLEDSVTASGDSVVPPVACCRPTRATTPQAGSQTDGGRLRARTRPLPVAGGCTWCSSRGR